MYHISVFGSPPSRAATSPGGWTCSESFSRASRILMSSGKRPPRGLTGPSHAGALYSISQRRSFPASGPLAITLTPSGRSVISHDSPIGTLGGSFFPKSSSNLRPPQTRSLKIGWNLSGWIMTEGGGIEVSTFSGLPDCMPTKHGTDVWLDPDNLTTGWNGSPSGLRHKYDDVIVFMPQ